MTKLTNEQIERIFGDIKGAKYVDIHAETNTAHPVFTTNKDVRHNVDDLEEILSLRQEVEKLKNPWISVEDELPPNNVNKVYVWDSESDPWISTKENDEYWDRDWISVDGTTHWQHLPKVPKEQDHE